MNTRLKFALAAWMALALFAAAMVHLERVRNDNLRAELARYKAKAAGLVEVDEYRIFLIISNTTAGPVWVPKRLQWKGETK